MAGNTIGTLFRLTSFGESHGDAIGGVIDGCPANIEIDIDTIQYDLNRRKPGQSKITTQRKEEDKIKILSGLFEGKTTGTPIGFVIENTNQRSKDYSHIKDVYRPSHADYTYDQKYGIRDYKGGGRSSARETIARVVAGSIAKQILNQLGVKIYAYVSAVGEISIPNKYSINSDLIENNIVRCPDASKAEEMIEFIDSIRKNGDTVGGQVSCVIENAPVGLGEPVFDKFHADLGKAMLSINAVKLFEIGSGVEGTKMRGSEHNDLFEVLEGKVITQSNNSGGVQGGITNGQPINFTVGFKPVATIMQKQESINSSNEKVELEGKGRHDPCVVPRAVPIVEAMAAITLLDFYLRNKVINL